MTKNDLENNDRICAAYAPGNAWYYPAIQSNIHTQCSCRPASQLLIRRSHRTGSITTESTMSREQKEMDAFQASAFLQEEDVPDKFQYDLPNDIHLLFAQTRFSPNISYRLVEPSARLATQLLKSPLLNRFWWNIITKTPAPSPNLTQTYADEGNDQILHRTPPQLARIDAALNQLSGMIRYLIKEKADAWYTVASTAANVNPPTPPGSPFTNGTGSKIYMGSTWYRKLQAVSEGNQDDSAALLWFRFELAVALVHEVCHAILNARLPRALGGRHPQMTFFGNCAIGEVGFEAESRLFGGTILRYREDGPRYYRITTQARRGRLIAPRESRRTNEKSLRHISGPETRVGKRVSKRTSKTSSLTGVMTLLAWPSRKIPVLYKRQNLMIVSYDDKLPLYDLAWRVPLESIASLFTDRFWKRAKLNSENSKMLRLERKVGYFLNFAEDDFATPKPPGAGMVPRGYMKVRGVYKHTIVKV